MYKLREVIEHEIASHNLYIDKLQFVMGKIEELIKSKIQFVAYEDEELYGLSNITSCLVPETCGDYAYCKLEKGH